MTAVKDSWWQQIKRFFGFAPLVVKDDARSDIELLSITDFRAKTAMGSPAQAAAMGWLKEAGISPHRFQMGQGRSLNLSCYCS